MNLVVAALYTYIITYCVLGCNLVEPGVPSHCVGQVVPHVHFHIIPKFAKEDGLGIQWPAGKLGGDGDELAAKIYGQAMGVSAAAAASAAAGAAADEPAAPQGCAACRMNCCFVKFCTPS